MRTPTFIIDYHSASLFAVTCRESGERFSVVRAGGEWVSFDDEKIDAYHSTRADAVDRIDALARLALIVF